jgi:hypothetical protein
MAGGCGQGWRLLGRQRWIERLVLAARIDREGPDEKPLRRATRDGWALAAKANDQYKGNSNTKVAIG